MSGSALLTLGECSPRPPDMPLGPVLSSPSVRVPSPWAPFRPAGSALPLGESSIIRRFLKRRSLHRLNVCCPNVPGERPASRKYAHIQLLAKNARTLLAKICALLAKIYAHCRPRCKPKICMLAAGQKCPLAGKDVRSSTSSLAFQTCRQGLGYSQRVPPPPWVVSLQAWVCSPPR